MIRYKLFLVIILLGLTPSHIVCECKASCEMTTFEVEMKPVVCMNSEFPSRKHFPTNWIDQNLEYDERIWKQRNFQSAEPDYDPVISFLSDEVTLDANLVYNGFLCNFALEIGTLTIPLQQHFYGQNHRPIIWNLEKLSNGMASLTSTCCTVESNLTTSVVHTNKWGDSCK